MNKKEKSSTNKVHYTFSEVSYCRLDLQSTLWYILSYAEKRSTQGISVAHHMCHSSRYWETCSFVLLCVPFNFRCYNDFEMKSENWKYYWVLRSEIAQNWKQNFPYLFIVYRVANMFRRFSLFDSSPPAAKISINPPKTSKSERKSLPLNGAIIESLQIPVSKKTQKNFLINSYKRSKSLDQSSPKIIANDKQTSLTKQRAKSATLPPIIANRSLPQPYQATTDRWFNKIGVPHRRTACTPWPRSNRSPFCYHVRNQVLMPWTF